MKELNTQLIIEFIENYRYISKKNMFLECPAQESLSKLSVTNQKEEDLWEDTSDCATRQ
jgi:hypothetical protein